VPILWKLWQLRAYSVYAERSIPWHLGKKIFVNLNMTLKLCKHTFSNIVLLNAPEVVYMLHFHKQYQIQLSLYWVCAELHSSYTQYTRNLVPCTLGISLNLGPFSPAVQMILDFFFQWVNLYRAPSKRSSVHTECMLNSVQRILSMSLT